MFYDFVFKCILIFMLVDVSLIFIHIVIVEKKIVRLGSSNFISLKWQETRIFLSYKHFQPCISTKNFLKFSTNVIKLQNQRPLALNFINCPKSEKNCVDNPFMDEKERKRGRKVNKKPKSKEKENFQYWTWNDSI